MELLQLVQRLSKANGPTGYETGAVKAAQTLLQGLVQQTTIDAMGNLIGILPSGKDGAKRIVLDAHLDEVCLVVTGHEEGFLKVQSSFGGVDPRLLPATRVLALADTPVYGVVSCLPPHILTAQEQEQPFDLEKLRIDCGLRQQEAQRLIPVGTPVVYTTAPSMLGRNKLCGKALDHRAGFAVLLRTLELIKGARLDADVYVVGSVQEESTELGAATAAFFLSPDEAIVVDATFGNTPDSGKDSTFRLGGGPTIGVGPALSRPLMKKLQAVARAHEIAYQDEVMEGSTGTNSTAIGIARNGVPCAVVSFPLRYMHTPCEVVCLDDLEAAAQLLAHYLLQTEGGVKNA